MIADPKGYNLVENWAAQWLQLRNLGRTEARSEAVSQPWTTSCSMPCAKRR